MLHPEYCERLLATTTWNFSLVTLKLTVITFSVLTSFNYTNNLKLSCIQMLWIIFWEFY